MDTSNDLFHDIQNLIFFQNQITSRNWIKYNNQNMESREEHQQNTKQQ